MSDLVFDDGTTRFDLSQPQDRKRALELAFSALDSYRYSLSHIMLKENARTNADPTFVRDLQNAYDRSSQFFDKLSGDSPESLIYVLRNVRPLASILRAAIAPADESLAAALMQRERGGAYFGFQLPPHEAS